MLYMNRRCQLYIYYECIGWLIDQAGIMKIFTLFINHPPPRWMQKLHVAPLPCRRCQKRLEATFLFGKVKRLKAFSGRGGR